MTDKQSCQNQNLGLPIERKKSIGRTYLVREPSASARLELTWSMKRSSLSATLRMTHLSAARRANSVRSLSHRQSSSSVKHLMLRKKQVFKCKIVARLINSCNLSGVRQEHQQLISNFKIIKS